MPYMGVVYRVENADLINGHLCYFLLDPKGVARPVAHAQHTEIVSEITRLARYKFLDRFRRPKIFGDQWVKERKWNSRLGTIQYRLADYWDESRWNTWLTQEELSKWQHVGEGTAEVKPPVRAEEGTRG